jgi:hypothetical protein
MCINGRAGDIRNRWTDLSGISVRDRDTIGGLESLIDCSVLVHSLHSIVPLEWNFVRGVSGGHGSDGILNARI